MKTIRIPKSELDYWGTMLKLPEADFSGEKLAACRSGMP